MGVRIAISIPKTRIGGSTAHHHARLAWQGQITTCRVKLRCDLQSRRRWWWRREGSWRGARPTNHSSISLAVHSRIIRASAIRTIRIVRMIHPSHRHEQRRTNEGSRHHGHHRIPSHTAESLARIWRTRRAHSMALSAFAP